MTTQYTIELECLKRGAIYDFLRKIQDKIGIPIEPRIIEYAGATDQDTSADLCTAAIALAERQGYWVIRVSRVMKGVAIKQ